ncbi:hypothetical protein [Nannocystis pusilla]|uniref:hypothetical protein n=1 Tax=Nannocystis pusilla TaxID=889268 RepID=UPI003B81D0B7
MALHATRGVIAHGDSLPPVLESVRAQGVSLDDVCLATVPALPFSAAHPHGSSPRNYPPVYDPCLWPIRSYCAAAGAGSLASQRVFSLVRTARGAGRHRRDHHPRQRQVPRHRPRFRPCPARPRAALAHRRAWPRDLSRRRAGPPAGTSARRPFSRPRADPRLRHVEPARRSDPARPARRSRSRRPRPSQPRPQPLFSLHALKDMPPWTSGSGSTTSIPSCGAAATSGSPT